MKTARFSALYHTFSSKEGSQHIASEYAIKSIQSLIERFNITTILEVGLGIGSISGILLDLNENLSYWGTEGSEFCLKALPENLGSHYSRLHIYDNISSIPEDLRFEMIIIDGKDGALEALKQYISPHGIIVVEGDRELQVEQIRQLFSKNKRVHSISLEKNKVYSPFPVGDWQGGLKIIFTDPTQTQKLWWAKEKCLTFLKYKYPGRFMGKKVKTI